MYNKQLTINSYQDAFGFLHNKLKEIALNPSKKYGQTERDSYHIDIRKIVEETGIGNMGNDPKSAYFMDAAWDFARRGVIRPSKIHTNTAEHTFVGDGVNFSITEQGKNWLLISSDKFVFCTSEIYTKQLQSFLEFFGESFFIRAAEASNCYEYRQYLACCIMVQVAIEALLKHINGQSDDKSMWQKSQREEIISKITKQDKKSEKTLLILLEKIRPLRNNSAHNTDACIEEHHAYQCLADLLHFCTCIKKCLSSSNL